MTLDTLLASELAQWAIAIGAGLGTLFSVIAGMKAKDRRNGNSLELAHEVLKKLQIMHEDIARIANDVPNIQLVKHDVGSLEDHMQELAKTLAVMMDTSGKTYDKVDRIDSIVNLLKEIERRRNING